MSRATIILDSNAARLRATQAVAQWPLGTVVTLKASKRTLPQNDRLHAMLTEIARQLVWHNEKWPMEDWKYNLLACFKSEVRSMPRADGFGVVPVGGTRDLTMQEASDFMEFIAEFGARNGVEFSDTRAMGRVA